METSKQLKNREIIFLDVLFTILTVVIVFLPLLLIFDLPSYDFYRHFAFGSSLFNVVMFLLLCIAELASLSFDKTATKNTAFFTFFIFFAYLFSSEIVHALTFIGIEVGDIVKKIFFLLSNLSLFGGMYFIIRFFEKDYALAKWKKAHLIILASLLLLDSLFIFVGLDILSLVVSGMTALFLIYVSFFYFFGVRKKSNPLPGRITSIMVLSLAYSLMLNFFSSSKVFYINSNGIINLLAFLVIMGYIFIYAHFMVAKTKGYYAYEEDDKKRKLETPLMKMKVTCFHAFDCYLGDMHLDFPSKKSKEFFALLVTLRGKALTMDKAITYLWPDKDIELAKRSYRDVIYKLRRYFEQIGYKGVLFRRAETLLNVNSLDCDYYLVIDKKKPYDGSPLMPEYDWSFDFESAFKDWHFFGR